MNDLVIMNYHFKSNSNLRSWPLQKSRPKIFYMVFLLGVNGSRIGVVKNRQLTSTSVSVRLVEEVKELSTAIIKACKNIQKFELSREKACLGQGRH